MDDGPDKIPTKELPKADPAEISAALLRRVDANVTFAVGQLASFRSTLNDHDARLSTLEEDKRRLSGGVKELARVTSQNDLEHEAKLAEALAEQQQLKAKVNFWVPLFTKLDAFIEHPRTKAVAWAVILYLLAKIGVKIQ